MGVGSLTTTLQNHDRRSEVTTGNGGCIHTFRLAAALANASATYNKNMAKNMATANIADCERVRVNK